jgi:small subunit ribosomal protein S5
MSIPYETTQQSKAARVKLLPAAQGTGLKAGSSVRTVLELAGYNNILSKIMGTNNKLNNAYAAILALSSFKKGKFPKKKDKKSGGKNETPTDNQKTTQKDAPKKSSKSATKKK